MHNRVLTAVIKHDATKVASFSASPATLHNHHRFQIKERSYPALVPKPNSKVDGVLLRGLSSEDQQRLDDFEGDDYIRTLVTVIDSRNETTCEGLLLMTLPCIVDSCGIAWVYIWSKGASDPLLYGVRFLCFH